MGVKHPLGTCQKIIKDTEKRERTSREKTWNWLGKKEEEAEKGIENIVTKAGVDKVWEREALLPGNNKEN